MRMQISKLHLGRYRLDMIDEDTGQIMRGYDCGSAGIMVALTEWIFRDEASQYQKDQKASSDQLGQEAIERIRAEPIPDSRHTLFLAKDSPKLTALLKKSVEAFNAMPIEERRKMQLIQAKSWVIGEMLLENPNMTREYAEHIYDEVAR